MLVKRTNNSQSSVSSRYKAAASTSFFNEARWRPVGDPVGYPECLDILYPGASKKVDGNIAEVVTLEFENGFSDRLVIPMKNSDPIQLKLSGESELVEGDRVDITTIKGQLLEKIGSKDIVRYDAPALEYVESEVEEA